MLDIDCVINASHHAARPPGPDAYPDVAEYLVSTDEGRKFIFWTSPTLIRELCDLHESSTVEIAWLTTWQHQAQRHVSPALGLPEFPVAADSRGRFSDYHWKQQAAEEALQLGRPIIWIDDTEITGEAQAAYRKSSVPYLLVSPDSTLGLTRVHMAEVMEFLALQAASN